MALSPERYMALKTVIINVQREWREMLADLPLPIEDRERFFVDLRAGIVKSLDRSKGMLERLECGEDIVCRHCTKGIEAQRLSGLLFTKRCGWCAATRDAKARIKWAVRLHRGKLRMFR